MLLAKSLNEVNPKGEGKVRRIGAPLVGAPTSKDGS